MQRDFRKEPITYTTLAHTGQFSGDDSGYRDVKVIEDPHRTDPLVIASGCIEKHPVYAIGGTAGVCLEYPESIGASWHMFVRAPVNAALLAVDCEIAAYDRKIVLLDAYRSAETQAVLFKYIFRLVSKGADIATMSVTDTVHFGTVADNVASFVSIKKDWVSQQVLTAMVRSTGFSLQFHDTMQGYCITLEDAIKRYVTIRANLGFETKGIELDPFASTAHGSGGATDLWLKQTSTDRWICLGVPFDWNGRAATMWYFEDPGNLYEYQQLIRDNPTLLEYLRYFGINEPADMTAERFKEIRDERRVLYHTCTSHGASFYHLENWHFNWPGTKDGVRGEEFPNGGNACHSFLENVRDESGEVVAIWGNEYAHTRVAARLNK